MILKNALCNGILIIFVKFGKIDKLVQNIAIKGNYLNIKIG
jgi:hypothetical protein